MEQICTLCLLFQNYLNTRFQNCGFQRMYPKHLFLENHIKLGDIQVTLFSGNLTPLRDTMAA